MTLGHTCHHCHAPATKLCDFILGFATDQKTIGLEDEMITCSRPLCNECAREVGWTSLGGGDSIDLCRDHADRPERIGPAPLAQLLAAKRRLQIRIVQKS